MNLIIHNEEGEAIGIGSDCLMAQVVALGLNGKDEVYRAVRMLVGQSTRLLQALEELKNDKTDRRRIEAYKTAENGLKTVCKELNLQFQ